MMNYRILLGIPAGLGIKTVEVSPQTWKAKVMSGMGKDKGTSIVRVSELYPELVFNRKKDHGRADAVLIGWYGSTEILRVHPTAKILSFNR